MISRRANSGELLKDKFRKANGARLLLSEPRLVPKWLGKLEIKAGGYCSLEMQDVRSGAKSLSCRKMKLFLGLKKGGEVMAAREEGAQLQGRQHRGLGKRIVPFGGVSTELPRPAWVIFIL